MFALYQFNRIDIYLVEPTASAVFVVFTTPLRIKLYCLLIFFFFKSSFGSFVDLSRYSIISC